MKLHKNPIERMVKLPTYQYRCTYCGQDFEVQQSINSSPGAECPKCNQITKYRLISKIGGIIFKGAGWPGKEIAKK